MALAITLARALFRQLLPSRPVLAGLAAALVPALVLAIAIGAPLGSALGRQLFREWGLPTTGDVFGVASGVAIVLALVELAGGALGLAVARLLKH